MVATAYRAVAVGSVEAKRKALTVSAGPVGFGLDEHDEARTVIDESPVVTAHTQGSKAVAGDAAACAQALVRVPWAECQSEATAVPSLRAEATWCLMMSCGDRQDCAVAVDHGSSEPQLLPTSISWVALKCLPRLV